MSTNPNLARVLSCLDRLTATTASEIAEALSLSPVTVRRLLRTLREAGKAEVRGILEGRGRERAWVSTAPTTEERGEAVEELETYQEERESAVEELETYQEERESAVEELQAALESPPPPAPRPAPLSRTLAAVRRGRHVSRSLSRILGEAVQGAATAAYVASGTAARLSLVVLGAVLAPVVIPAVALATVGVALLAGFPLRSLLG